MLFDAHFNVTYYSSLVIVLSERIIRHYNVKLYMMRPQ